GERGVRAVHPTGEECQRTGRCCWRRVSRGGLDPDPGEARTEPVLAAEDVLLCQFEVVAEDRLDRPVGRKLKGLAEMHRWQQRRTSQDLAAGGRRRGSGHLVARLEFRHLRLNAGGRFVAALNGGRAVQHTACSSLAARFVTLSQPHWCISSRKGPATN